MSDPSPATGVATVRHPLQGEGQMSISQPGSEGDRIARELARERHERMLHDEARARVSSVDELRCKDARESMNSTNLKRPPGR
jgi:hypothetical protein